MSMIERRQLTMEDVDEALKVVRCRVERAMKIATYGQAFISHHEILGHLEEQFAFVKKSLRDHPMYDPFRTQLSDLATVAVLGMASLAEPRVTPEPVVVEPLTKERFDAAIKANSDKMKEIIEGLIVKPCWMSWQEKQSSGDWKDYDELMWFVGTYCGADMPKTLSQCVAAVLAHTTTEASQKSSESECSDERRTSQPCSDLSQG